MTLITKLQLNFDTTIMKIHNCEEYYCTWLDHSPQPKPNSNEKKRPLQRYLFYLIHHI